MEIDVADCLQRWKKGDEGAAKQLVEHLYPVVFRIARHHLSRREHEEDLVQEILMKVFSRLHQYKADAPLTHWVSRIAVTTCLDRLRAQKVRPEITWTDLTPEESSAFDLSALASPTPDAGLAIEARDLVDKMLSTLSAEDRSLILMTDLEGRSIEEIAQLTGWGLSKIKMRLSRLRAQLRLQIQKLEK